MTTFAIELNKAEAQFAKLVEQVEAGAEVLITRNGMPLARLVRAGVEEARERVPGSAKGLFTVPADFDAPMGGFRD